MAFLTSVPNSKLLHVCVWRFMHTSVYVCVYAWLPRRVQRPGWARMESCAQQLPAAASDRHSTALISWPVTIDTHSCAALREQTEHGLSTDRGCKVQGKASSENMRHWWTHPRLLSTPSGQRTPPHAFAQEVMLQFSGTFSSSPLWIFLFFWWTHSSITFSGTVSAAILYFQAFLSFASFSVDQCQ